MGRRGEEGIATEGEQIDCEKGRARKRSSHFLQVRFILVEMEKIDPAVIDLADPVPKDFASDCGEIASVT